MIEAFKRRAEQMSAEILFEQAKIVIGKMQVLSATGEVFNHVDSGEPMWAGDGDRAVRLPVGFLTPFASAPMVVIGLSGIDSAQDQNLRFALRPTDVTSEGFTIDFATWGDTHIARASVFWQAVGPV